MQNNDFIIISKNIIRRRKVLLAGMIFTMIFNLLFFIITYIIKGNEVLFLVLDSLINLALIAYLAYYIVKGKALMFESLYKLGRVIYSLPIGFYLLLTLNFYLNNKIFNYEYFAYMILSLALELFVFRYNIKDKNPIKINNKCLGFGILSMALVPLFLVIGYFSPAQISILDFSRTLKYDRAVNSVRVNGIYAGASKYVNIPNELYGTPVTEVLDYSFYDANLDYVFVPSSVESIGFSSLYSTRNVVIEGDTYLKYGSLNGVTNVEFLMDDKLVRTSNAVFNGNSITVDRKLIDKYRQSEDFKDYRIEPKINDDECFITFKTDGYEYINTVIVKKGSIVDFDILKNTKDESYTLYDLTKNFKDDNDYYKEIYHNGGGYVIPFWGDKFSNYFVFGDKLYQSFIDYSPSREKVILNYIDYHDGEELEEVYTSISRLYTLPTITEKPRSGFSDVHYFDSDGNKITSIAGNLNEKAVIDAKWTLEKPNIIGVSSLQNGKLERVYDPSKEDLLIPNVTHPKDASYSFKWNNGIDTIESNEYTIKNVSQSGRYTLSVTAKYTEFGIDYESKKSYEFVVTIDRATPRLNVSDLEVIYDGNVHKITDYAIEYGEESEIFVNYYEKTPIQCGTYTVGFYVEQTDNFNWLDVKKTIKINKRPLRVTLYDDMCSTYGDELDTRFQNGNVKEVEACNSDRGLIEGDLLKFYFYGVNKDLAGEYDVSCMCWNSNYLIEYDEVSYKLNKRKSTIKPKPINKTYGEKVEIENPTTNILSSDLSYFHLDVYSDIDFNNKVELDKIDAGTYYIGYESDEELTKNYDVSFTPSLIIIAKKEINISKSDTVLTYNGQKQVINVVASGNVYDDRINDIVSITFPDSINAGTYNFNVLINDKYKNNYMVNDSLEYTINKRVVDIKINDCTITYGDNLNLTYKELNNTSILDGDKELFKIGLDAMVNSYGAYDCGTYDITYLSNDALNKNYAFNIEDGKCVINKHDLEIKLDDVNVYYGENFKPSYTVNGFVNGEDISSLSGDISFDTNYIEKSKVGTYYIKASGLTSNNYNITYKDGNVNCNALAITITLDDKTITKGDNFDLSTLVNVDGLLSGDTISFAVIVKDNGNDTSRLDLGTYIILVSTWDNSNYQISNLDTYSTLTVE